MKKILTGTELVIRKICYYLCYLSMAVVVVLMFMMTIDALLGLFFSSRIYGGLEMEQLMLSLLVFSSWAYTQTEHGHIHVVMFIAKMPQKIRFILYSITSLISCVLCGISTYGVWQIAVQKMGNGEATGTLLIPMYPFYFFECVMFALFTICLLADLMRGIVSIYDKETAEDTMKFLG